LSYAPSKELRKLTNVIEINRELISGQSKLNSIFSESLARMHKAGELLRTNEIYHLRVGWACQFHNLPNARRAIVYVYLPGDVIGFDTFLCTRLLGEILTLTAVTVETIAAEARNNLMANRSIALYVAWLLGQRQQRINSAAISSLDAPGRVGAMVLDFYKRLRHRKLITGSNYNLPMSHSQIGDYLGLTVVHISRVLRSLREEGIVDSEKHCVAIMDLERLRSVAQNGRILGPGLQVCAAQPESASKPPAILDPPRASAN
jgi:CRP-like cAMP-binding protein